jgi:hypothetical protein
MIITVKYDKADKLDDFEINATDFYIVARTFNSVIDKKKQIYQIPEVRSWSTDGGNFREVKKEIRQSLIELDNLKPNGSK